MALAGTFGVTLAGVAGQLVEIEADVSAGIPGLSFTGLPDKSVLESRDRMRAALVNSGIAWPNHKITLAQSLRTCRTCSLPSMSRFLPTV